MGACVACDGSGNAQCAFCEIANASEVYRERGRQYLMCRPCLDEATEIALAADVVRAQRNKDNNGVET